jgi:hypothetical protein
MISKETKVIYTGSTNTTEIRKLIADHLATMLGEIHLDSIVLYADGMYLCFKNLQEFEINIAYKNSGYKLITKLKETLKLDASDEVIFNEIKRLLDGSY